MTSLQPIPVYICRVTVFVTVAETETFIVVVSVTVAFTVAVIVAVTVTVAITTAVNDTAGDCGGGQPFVRIARLSIMASFSLSSTALPPAVLCRQPVYRRQLYYVDYIIANNIVSSTVHLSSPVHLSSTLSSSTIYIFCQYRCRNYCRLRYRRRRWPPFRSDRASQHHGVVAIIVVDYDIISSTTLPSTISSTVYCVDCFIVH